MLDCFSSFFLQFVEGRAGATDMLNKFDFYIIPVMNPDGYEYTWKNVSYISLDFSDFAHMADRLLSFCSEFRENSKVK